MLHKMPESRKERSGFTLIEVIFSLLMAGIFFSGLSLILQQSFGNLALRTSCDLLAEDIRFLEQRALAEQNPSYYIRLETEINSYSIRKNGPLGPEILYRHRLPCQVVLAGSNFASNEIRISSRGIPTCGGTITLLDRRTGRCRYVIIASVTGRVRVDAHKPEYGKY